MDSWPAIDLPSVALNLPPLKIKCSSGKMTDVSSDWRMYVCGITPYDATHLGHAATYLNFDLINRYQKLRGATVHFSENITDIDDPLLERANRDGQEWKTLADDQIDLFARDMQGLRVLPPEHFVPVTQTIPQLISALEALVAKGYTYKIDGDLYFKITPFLDSLPLALEDALKIFSERGGDPDRIGKENPLDPLLWLANRPGEPGWPSSLGHGRPGWHIECSVIALMTLVGEDYLSLHEKRAASLDLQGGGNDLIFPHHFMSAALGKALVGIDFASAYIHTGMVGLDGEKMSKSKGNLVFVSKLLAQGIDPMALRYALINSNFNEDRMWSKVILEDAEIKVANLRSTLSKVEVFTGSNFLNHLLLKYSHGLDTKGALEILEKWALANLLSEELAIEELSKLDIGEISIASPGEISRFIDSLFGLAL